MPATIPSCPKCREFKWFHNSPPRNWKDKAREEEFCLFHAPVEDKVEISNFNFQLKLYINELIANNHPITLRGTVFPHKVRFSDLFQKPLSSVGVDLTDCVFTKEVDCSEFVFENVCNINGSDFHEDVRFDEAIFEEKMDFHEVTFKNNVSFGKAHFKRGVLIANSHFKGRFHFEDVNSPGLTMIAISVENNAYYDRSEIGKVEILNSKFHGHTSVNQGHFDSLQINKNIFDLT